ncbi:sensitivity to red-light reduced protein [Yamadazyma tenuis]|nr:sensitivity to red-light reduced protein [Yamadazyma tenuis]
MSSMSSHSSHSAEQNIKHSTILSPINQSPLVPNYTAYKFLIVDDNLINLKILYKILNKLFPKALIVKLNNSSTVLKLVEQEKFDLIFLDIEMPPINGIEISKRIRSTKKFNRMGLIAVTTRSTEKDMKIYKKIGIDFTFKKPLNCNLNLILNNIEIILNFRKNKKD